MKIKSWMVAFSFLLCSPSAFAVLSFGIDGHKAGDIISIQTPSQVAGWCDFNKQIVVLPAAILCTYNGITLNPDAS